MKAKYIPIKSGTLIFAIAQETEIPGYSNSVLKIALPEENEIRKWTEKQTEEFEKATNIKNECHS